MSALASAATKTKTINFTGKYAGTATLLISGSAVTIASVKGSGTGTSTVLGAGTSKVTGAGSGAASAQCDPFSGTGAIANGANKINFKITTSTGKGCSSGESGPITVTFSGTAKATGGTGKAKGAAGNLTFSGSVKLGDVTGTQSGAYTVKVSGKLTVNA